MVVSHGRVWIQAGVSIIGCNQAGGPRVLTRISLYQDWISAHIIPSSDQPGFIQLGIGQPTSLPQPTTTLSSQAPPTRSSQAPSTPSPSLATTLPLPDRGRSCRFRPLNNIAIPTVWISVIIGPVSNNTDRKLLAKNTLTQLEQVSKRYFKDPEQRIANILQCTQRESVVDLDMQLTFQPVSKPPPLRLCFPGNGLVRVALAETFRGYTHVEIRNITNGLSVIAKFSTNIVYEEALSDPTSPQFKNMERRIVRVIDEINRAKYGILYKRTIVLGFRPRSQSRRSKRDVMATEVELQEEFESNSTDTTDTHSILISSDDVRDTLKKAAGNSTLGFTLDLNTVSIAEASKAVMWYPASFGTISVIGPCLLLPWMWLAF
ncbi:uncharacterized protein LOC134456045 [Engraulis encrasicolus]|uniref:uncharacterized protein LOC134456045 n=1 Tax=Engraulis encrasicolus TaxID=184585 RepID=UPI002FD67EAC